MKIRVLGAEEIAEALSMEEAIEIVKEAYVQLSTGQAQSPLRTMLRLQHPGEAALVMPGYLEKSQALGAKMVTVIPQNPLRGLPATQALVILLDAETGQPCAILEGTLLTRLRTGAAAGLASQVFSRPESSRLAMFGAGGQAFHQLLGILAVRKIHQIRIFDLLPDRVDTLLDMARRVPQTRGLEIGKARSPAEALEGADIVMTITTSSTPVFDGTLLKEGTHINAFGAFRPSMQEVDETTLLRSRIFVDSIPACLEEAGDLLIPIQKGRLDRSAILGEIGEVICGKVAGRTHASDITYFKSVGNTVQDLSVGRAILERARAKNLGQVVEL
jgi:ornithine cyclodeaminase